MSASPALLRSKLWLRRPLASRPSVLLALGALLLALITLSLGSGALTISATELLGGGWRWLTGAEPTFNDRVLLAIRLPRTLFAVLAGAGLGLAGAAMQGLFRNPLADPGLIGVSSGAALGAVTVIVLGSTLGLPAIWREWSIAAGAFGCGLLATALAWLIGRRGTGTATLLLAGVAINAVAVAGIGWLSYLASDEQLRDLTFWTLGSLGAARWSALGIVALLMAGPMLWLPREAAALNAMLLGDADARYLGFSPQAVQRRLIVLVALLVAACVAFIGSVGFVGLIVPHLIRLWRGPDHRLLLPASALAGAALLVAADTAARTVVAPAELPLGVLTALIGGPFFMWLLLRGAGRNGHRP